MLSFAQSVGRDTLSHDLSDLRDERPLGPHLVREYSETTGTYIRCLNCEHRRIALFSYLQVRYLEKPRRDISCPVCESERFIILRIIGKYRWEDNRWKRMR